MYIRSKTWRTLRLHPGRHQMRAPERERERERDRESFEKAAASASLFSDFVDQLLHGASMVVFLLEVDVGVAPQPVALALTLTLRIPYVLYLGWASLVVFKLNRFRCCAFSTAVGHGKSHSIGPIFDARLLRDERARVPIPNDTFDDTSVYPKTSCSASLSSA